VDFLRDRFHEELDDEGDIVIAGERFTRHDILSGLAPEAYKAAFNDWLEDRKVKLLEKANEILSHYDNAERFHQLTNCLSE
jgi:hypothetical protein